jgi:type IV pilus assembly protein PilB
MNRTSTYTRSIAGGEEPDIIQLVNLIVLDGVSAGASDIHIEGWDDSVAIRVRIDGVLTELVHLPLDWMERIQQRFKVMASLVSYQSDIPQEGQVPADPDIGGVELRVSYFPTVRGGKIVIRIFDPRSRKFDLDTLGMDPDVLEDFKLLLNQPNGLLLLTGPTGSGKTTLIYSALQSIVNREGPSVSISTVEDPVEARLSMISQAQINPAKDFTYPLALRSLLRQDPQVIMVGEIRDPETAMIALRASLTGHLVISTIHSGSCAGVFARLINMQIEPFLLASSILGIIVSGGTKVDEIWRFEIPSSSGAFSSRSSS